MKASLLCFVLSAGLIAGPAFAADPPNVAVNVIHGAAMGVIRVNGVPIHRFTPTPDGGSSTDVIGIGQWAIEGDNTITVETQSKDGGTTKVSVVRTIGEPDLFDGEIAGAGSTQCKVSLKGVPRWGWLDAEQWTGDNQALLAALGALHATFVKGDTKTIMRLYKPFADDMRPYTGPLAESDLAEPLKGGTVPPLPTDLTVDSYYDHRLFVVRRADGSAPIRVDNEAVIKGMPALEAGEYWIRKGGQWQIIRP